MINLIDRDKSSERPTTFLNPFSFIVARKNIKRLSQFNIEIDGGMLVVVLRFFGLKVQRKSFDMTSLAPIVFENAIKNNQSVFFIGTKPKVIDLAIQNIQNQFPELNICGFRDGYMSIEERELELIKIKSLNPCFVICGMGAPLQEQFLIDLKNIGWAGKGYTCGGFLHQTANNIEYYPKWITRFGLRAFYRMYDEPKLIKRYFIDYPIAMIVIVYDLIKYKMS